MDNGKINDKEYENEYESTIDFDGNIERYLTEYLSMDDSEASEFYELYQLRKDYELVCYQEFGKSSFFGGFDDEFTNTSEKYRAIKADYKNRLEELRATSSGEYSGEFGRINNEVTRYAYLAMSSKVSKMNLINNHLNNSDLEFSTADSGLEFDDVDLSRIGTFKAYLSFEDALRDNYMLEQDQVLNDDPQLEILNDKDTFEDFKESYLVNMSEINQIPFEKRNEPVFFARVDYESGCSLPSEHYISVSDLSGKNSDYDVLFDKINKVLKDSYSEGSMSKEVSITQVNGKPVFGTSKKRGATLEP